MTNESNGNRETRTVMRPPYAPYLTVKNFIGRLKEHGISHRIDKSIMGNLSGAAQSHLILGLRFLGLVDELDRPTDALRGLVEAYGDEARWAAAMGEVVRSAYRDYLNKLDLLTSTPAQLEETFRREGRTEGTVTEKAIRFFLKALDDARLSYSKMFIKTRGPKSGSRKRRTQPVGTQANGTSNGDDDNDDDAKDGDGDFAPPAATIVIPIHLPGRSAGKLIVPSSITESEVALVEAALNYLKLYAKMNAPATVAHKRGSV